MQKGPIFLFAKKVATTINGLTFLKSYAVFFIVVTLSRILLM